MGNVFTLQKPEASIKGGEKTSSKKKTTTIER